MSLDTSFIRIDAKLPGLGNGSGENLKTLASALCATTGFYLMDRQSGDCVLKELVMTNVIRESELVTMALTWSIPANRIDHNLNDVIKKIVSDDVKWQLGDCTALQIRAASFVKKEVLETRLKIISKILRRDYGLRKAATSRERVNSSFDTIRATDLDMTVALLHMRQWQKVLRHALTSERTIDTWEPYVAYHVQKNWNRKKKRLPEFIADATEDLEKKLKKYELKPQASNKLGFQSSVRFRKLLDHTAIEAAFLPENAYLSTLAHLQPIADPADVAESAPLPPPPHSTSSAGFQNRIPFDRQSLPQNFWLIRSRAQHAQAGESPGNSEARRSQAAGTENLLGSSPVPLPPQPSRLTPPQPIMALCEANSTRWPAAVQRSHSVASNPVGRYRAELMPPNAKTRDWHLIDVRRANSLLGELSSRRVPMQAPSGLQALEVNLLQQRRSVEHHQRRAELLRLKSEIDQCLLKEEALHNFERNALDSAGMSQHLSMPTTSLHGVQTLASTRAPKLPNRNSSTSTLATHRSPRPPTYMPPQPQRLFPHNTSALYAQAQKLSSTASHASLQEVAHQARPQIRPSAERGSKQTLLQIMRERFPLNRPTPKQTSTPDMLRDQAPPYLGLRRNTEHEMPPNQRTAKPQNIEVPQQTQRDTPHPINRLPALIRPCQTLESLSPMLSRLPSSQGQESTESLTLRLSAERPRAGGAQAELYRIHGRAQVPSSSPAEGNPILAATSRPTSRQLNVQYPAISKKPLPQPRMRTSGTAPAAPPAAPAKAIVKDQSGGESATLARNLYPRAATMMKSPIEFIGEDGGIKTAGGSAVGVHFVDELQARLKKMGNPKVENFQRLPQQESGAHSGSDMEGRGDEEKDARGAQEKPAAHQWNSTSAILNPKAPLYKGDQRCAPLAGPEVSSKFSNGAEVSPKDERRTPLLQRQLPLPPNADELMDTHFLYLNLNRPIAPEYEEIDDVQAYARTAPLPRSPAHFQSLPSAEAATPPCNNETELSSGEDHPSLYETPECDPVYLQPADAR